MHCTRNLYDSNAEPVLLLPALIIQCTIQFNASLWKPILLNNSAFKASKSDVATNPESGNPVWCESYLAFLICHSITNCLITFMQIEIQLTWFNKTYIQTYIQIRMSILMNTYLSTQMQIGWNGHEDYFLALCSISVAGQITYIDRSWLLCPENKADGWKL